MPSNCKRRQLPRLLICMSKQLHMRIPSSVIFPVNFGNPQAASLITLQYGGKLDIFLNQKALNGRRDTLKRQIDLLYPFRA